jgi:alternate F1F0 ATPase F1 subunit epsilon
MKLILSLPNKVLLEQEIDKLVVEDVYGSFCLLSDHIDITTALAQGIMTISYKDKDFYVAIDNGFLVKQDTFIYISTKNALVTEELNTLTDIMSPDYEHYTFDHTNFAYHGK